MINQVYQLTAPKVISVECRELSYGDNVLIRPAWLSICHADQRYFQGSRDAAAMRKKLPMALIHECAGRVVYDPTGALQSGQRVVLVPNMPGPASGCIFENYAKGSYFLSSGHDGFMQELVELPASRVIPYSGIQDSVAAVSEFVSVAAHAAARFHALAHPIRESVGIWGDGSLSYVTANVLKSLYPHMRVTVIGHNRRKLSMFSFADACYLEEDMPAGLEVDHAFECCGGEGSQVAIEDVIEHINPQGTLMLMGVTEHPVPIYTRMVLEKGLTLVGCSRSGRADFETALSLMGDDLFQKRLGTILYEDGAVRDIGDIHRVFADDLETPFKTVFRWDV